MIAKTRSFIEDVRQELDKVTWPTRREAMGLTGVVLAVMIFTAIVLGALDFIFAWGVGQVLKMFVAG